MCTGLRTNKTSVVSIQCKICYRYKWRLHIEASTCRVNAVYTSFFLICMAMGLLKPSEDSVTFDHLQLNTRAWLLWLLSSSLYYHSIICVGTETYQLEYSTLNWYRYSNKIKNSTHPAPPLLLHSPHCYSFWGTRQMLHRSQQAQCRCPSQSPSPPLSPQSCHTATGTQRRVSPGLGPRIGQSGSQ